jgi:hypothetical protein
VISDVGCFFGPEGIIFGCIFYAKKSVENCHIYITSRVFHLHVSKVYKISLKAGHRVGISFYDPSDKNASRIP